MNVFTNAMSLISNIKPAENVTIITITTTLDETSGVYNTTEAETSAYAHIQTNNVKVDDMGETATNTTYQYELWFVNLTPEVVDSLLSVDMQNTRIKTSDGDVLALIERGDYSYNGWIYAKAVRLSRGEA